MKKIILLIGIVMIILFINGCEYPRQDSIYCNNIKEDLPKCFPNGIEPDDVITWYDLDGNISEVKCYFE